MIVVGGGKEFFILPKKVTAGREELLIHSSDVKKPYNNVKPEVEWRDYKDRWDLLRGSQ